MTIALSTGFDTGNNLYSQNSVTQAQPTYNDAVQVFADLLQQMGGSSLLGMVQNHANQNGFNSLHGAANSLVNQGNSLYNTTVGANSNQGDLTALMGRLKLDESLTRSPGGDGSDFSADAKPMLSQVALHMDQHPEKYPVPDSGSWVNEINKEGDTHLNDNEDIQVRKAIGEIGAQMTSNLPGANNNGGIGNTKFLDGANPFSSALKGVTNSIGGSGLSNMLGGLNMGPLSHNLTAISNGNFADLLKGMGNSAQSSASQAANAILAQMTQGNTNTNFFS